MKCYVVYEIEERPSVVNPAEKTKVEIYRGKILAKNLRIAVEIMKGRFDPSRWDNLKLYERVPVI